MMSEGRAFTNPANGSKSAKPRHPFCDWQWTFISLSLSLPSRSTEMQFGSQENMMFFSANSTPQASKFSPQVLH